MSALLAVQVVLGLAAVYGIGGFILGLIFVPSHHIDRTPFMLGLISGILALGFLGLTLK